MDKLSPRLERFAAAFAAAAGFPKNPAPPINRPALDPCDQGIMQIMRSIPECNNSGTDSKRLQHNTITHFPTSRERAEALDLVKWVFAVAKLPADSPRFNWYVSRWDVPNKIARAKADGIFSYLIANCPPIDPAWLRFVPAALEAHRQFIAAHTRPKAERPKLSGNLSHAA